MKKTWSHVKRFLSCVAAVGFAVTVHAGVDMPWFMNVVPVWSGTNIQFTISEMIRQRDSAGLDLFLPSFSFHPQMTPARNIIPELCGRYREVKKGVEGKGIRLAILLQSLLGHGWNGKVPLTGEKWQHVVLADGTESPRYCSMDPGFRAYVAEVVGAIAKEKPEFILLDDDVGIRQGECFCPLHLAAISRALGKTCSREDVMRIYEDRPVDDPEVVAVNRVLSETICDFARTVVRPAIDSVDPKMRCGLCACWPGYWQLNELVHALAGNTRPFLRVNNACYADQPAAGLVMAFQGCHAVMYQLDGDVEIVDEADTFPQNYMSESATMFHAHLTSAMLSGLVGAKLWTAEFQEPIFTDSQRRYESRLKEYRGFYATLMQLSQEGINWKGVANPVVRPPVGYGGHPRKTARGIYPTRWGSPIEAMYAFPLRYDGIEKGGIIALRQADVERLSDEQIKVVLSGKTLVDSLAARVLTKRGFETLLGVHAGSGGPDFHFTCEWAVDGSHSISHMWNETDSELRPVSCKAVASWNFCRGDRFGAHEICAPAVIRFGNECGGQVVTFGWCFDGASHNLLRPVRKIQMMGELDWLNGAPVEMIGMSGDQALVRHGISRDGREIVAFHSFSYEILPRLFLRLLRDPQNIERLKPDGEWVSVDWLRENRETISIDVRVDPLEPIVIRF